MVFSEHDWFGRLSELHDNIDDGLAGQPAFVLHGGGYHVSFGLRIEGLGRAAEVLAVLVHELTLVPVHAVERVRTGSLFRLFGQFDELHQFVVDHLCKSQILFGHFSH